jgi:hypothetical protein
VKKGLIFTICLIVFVLSQAIALAAPVPEQEIKQLMSHYADARQKIEAGIDYPAFCLLRQELSAATQKFKEKYPKAEIAEDFAYLNQIYTDIAEIWQLRVEQKLQFLPKTGEQGKANGTSKYFLHTVTLRMQYPAVLNASLESKENGYFVNSVLDNLLNYVSGETKAVNDKLETRPAR